MNCPFRLVDEPENVVDLHLQDFEVVGWSCYYTHTTSTLLDFERPVSSLLVSVVGEFAGGDFQEVGHVRNRIESGEPRDDLVVSRLEGYLCWESFHARPV